MLAQVFNFPVSPAWRYNGDGYAYSNLTLSHVRSGSSMVELAVETRGAVGSIPTLTALFCSLKDLSLESASCQSTNGF
jgi:hypothetical protein